MVIDFHWVMGIIYDCPFNGALPLEQPRHDEEHEYIDTGATFRGSQINQSCFLFF